MPDTCLPKQLLYSELKSKRTELKEPQSMKKNSDRLPESSGSKERRQLPPKKLFLFHQAVLRFNQDGPPLEQGQSEPLPPKNQVAVTSCGV